MENKRAEEELDNPFKKSITIHMGSEDAKLMSDILYKYNERRKKE